MRWCAVLLIGAAACGGDTQSSQSQAGASAKAGSGERTDGFVGVDPSVFDCETVVPQALVASAVGGAVEPMESMFTPPRGTPKPCDYMMIDPPAVELQDGAPAPAQMLWSVQFDCRDDYVQSTAAEMQRLVDTEGAQRVTVGKWGIEHRDAALLFLDDDAPCSVKVVGPGVAQRGAIARLVAQKLTPGTAPMRPRAAP